MKWKGMFCQQPERAWIALLLVLLTGGCARDRKNAARLSPLGYTSGYPFHTGEYGASLDVLSRFISGPAGPGESNYFLDMWDNEELRRYARTHGLTNNHALFVISHGETIHTKNGPRYAYFPDDHHWPDSKKPHFSAMDIARALGPAKDTIHNLIIAGCDYENTFSSTELRRQFPNATNIIHSLPGKNAHEQLFRHALIYSSRDIKTLYDMPDRFEVGDFSDKWKRKKIRPYVAEIFRPAEKMPYQIQTAGRELLENESDTR
jgi:hypothetical protein